MIEPQKDISRADAEDDYDQGAEVPDETDAADVSWDNLTDKFSRARRGYFRPLAVSSYKLSLSESFETKEFLKELHCVEAIPGQADVILLGPTGDLSPQVFLSTMSLLDKWKGAIIHIVPEGIPAPPSSGFETDPSRPQGIIHVERPITSDKLAEALARACLWAPAPPDWNPGALPRDTELEPGTESSPSSFNEKEDGTLLLDPAPWLVEYVKKKFTLASERLTHRLAQNMTAISTRIVGCQGAGQNGKRIANVMRLDEESYQRQGLANTFVCCQNCSNEWLIKSDLRTVDVSTFCGQCGSEDIKDIGPQDPTNADWEDSGGVFSFNPISRNDIQSIYCPYSNHIIEYLGSLAEEHKEFIWR